MAKVGRPLHDLSGQIFGDWEVIKREEHPVHKYHGTWFLCRCKCGKEELVVSHALTRGESTSCISCRNKGKWMNYCDLSGQTFGKLYVVKRIVKPENKKSRGVYYLCNCSCGNETIADGKYLRNGRKYSCGCDKINGKQLPDGESAKNKLLWIYKNGAVKRKLEFSLTDEKFFRLTKQNCTYCHIEPSNIQRVRNSSSVYIYNGIDRVDSLKGYTKDNVVPCCGHCNYSKKRRTVDEFLEWVEKVYINSVLPNKTTS